MTDVLSIFHGGMEYVQRQRDLDKVLIIEADQGGTGPRPLDLDSGVVELIIPVREETSPRDELPSR